MEQSKKILKVLCVSDLPIAIKECNIVTPPDDIDSYIYKITHIPTNKYYWGKHKWDGIVYWHSGKCEELNRLWSTESDSFIYEVVEFGSYEYISKREDEILNDVFSKKDPLCWNKQRALNKKKDLEKDIKLVDMIYQNVINNKYDRVTLYKKDVKKIDFKQCRQTKVYRDKVLEIADKIIANNGNTTECDPLIILEDRIKTGKHLGINGFHTKNAFVKVKNSTQIDAIFIPKEDHKNIPDSLLTRLGNTFNKKSQRVKTDVEKADFIKELLEEFQGGYVHTDDMVRERAIKELNFSSREVASVLRIFNKEKKIFDITKSRNKSYSKLDSKKITSLTKEKKATYPNKTIWASSSTTLTLDRVYEVMEKENSNNAYVIIHHPDPIAEQTWKNNRHDKFVRLHKYSNSSLVIEYESITGWNDTDIVS